MLVSFRLPIKSCDDFERLIIALGTSVELVPGSLRLCEGAEMLSEQLAAECREKDLHRLGRAQTPGALIALFRCLWLHPLDCSHAVSVRLTATLASDPANAISVRLGIPSSGSMPRYVEAEGSRDPAVHKRLSAIYVSLARSAGLTFEEV